MKKLLSKILVVMMILTTMIPAVSFATDDVENASVDSAAKKFNVNLIVSPGGIAIFNGQEYGPGTNVIKAKAGNIIKAYSNAGYICSNSSNIYTVVGNTSPTDISSLSDETLTDETVTDETKIKQTITVGFNSVANVYGNPFYVTDGYFSGLNTDGIDIADTHDPKGDVLSATMTAALDESEYDLGDTANVTLSVHVSDGDGDTRDLVEVDFYEDGKLIKSFDHTNHVTDSTIVTSSAIIPTSESALTADEWDKTNTDTQIIYTKTLEYELVDRYANQHAAAILATASATIVVKFPRPINLWVASDDHADVYIDGKNRTFDTSSYASSSKYSKYVEDDTFVAAKAWDTNGTANIAGFKLVLENNNKDGYLTTDSNWYYYYSTESALSIPPNNNNNNKQWFEKDYSGDGWKKVTSITGTNIDPYWATDGAINFPTTAAWIWTSKFKHSTGNLIDSPIYLRSMAPVTYTVNYNSGSQNAFEASSHTNLVLGVATPTAPAMTIPDGYRFTGWSTPFAPTVTADVTYTAQWEKEFNLWVASDDYSEVYINSNPVIVTNNLPSGHYYSQVQKYLVAATDTPFVAARAWDTKQVISGFKLVLMKDNDKGYLTTNTNDWYYYTGITGPSIDINAKYWFDKDYVGDGWKKVTSDINPHPAWTAGPQFPSVGAIWIWSPNYSGNTIDTPVYLRSMPPKEPNAPETFTITYNPGNQLSAFDFTTNSGLLLNEETPTAPAMSIPSGFTFNGWNQTWESTVTGSKDYVAQWSANEVPVTPTRRTPTANIVDPAPPLVDQPVIEAVIEDEPTALADDPNVPQTSDSNSILLLLSLLFASGLGIVTLGRRKENVGK